MNFFLFIPITIFILQLCKENYANTLFLTVSEVAALVKCHDDFIPYPKAADDQTEFGKGKLLLNCLQTELKWPQNSKHTKSQSSQSFYTTIFTNFRNEVDMKTITLHRNDLFKKRNELFNKKHSLKIQGTNEELKKVYESIEENRKLSSALELAMKVLQDSVVKALLAKMLKKNNINNMKNIEENLDEKRYKDKLENLERDTKNLALILEDKGVNNHFGAAKTFVRMLEKLEKDLNRLDVVDVIFSGKQENKKLWWNTENTPEYGRTLYFVRHAEREDNINKDWNAEGKSVLKSDNSPLSKRGQKQASSLAHKFATMKIDHIFASPFDRTMETATRLLSKRKDVKLLKVEPGLMERRDMCEKEKPGFLPNDQLIAAPFNYKIDTGYKSVCDLAELTDHEGDIGDEDALIKRVKKTINTILEEHDGDTFVFVAHSASVGAAHMELTGFWNYVAQSSVSKFVELDKKGSNKFRLEYTSDESHLFSEIDYHQNQEYKNIIKAGKKNDFLEKFKVTFFKEHTVRAY